MKGILVFDGGQQQEHRTAKFLLPSRILLQHFLGRLKLGKLGYREAGFNQCIDIGSDIAMIFNHIMIQEPGFTRSLGMIVVNGPMQFFSAGAVESILCRQGRKDRSPGSRERKVLHSPAASNPPVERGI